MQRFALGVLVVGLAAQTFAGKEPSIDGVWRFPAEVYGKDALARLSLSKGRAVLSNMDYGATRTYADYYMTGPYTIKNGVLRIKFTEFRIDERRLTPDERAKLQADPERFAAFKKKMLHHNPFPGAKVRSVDAKRLVLLNPDGTGPAMTLVRVR